MKWHLDAGIGQAGGRRPAAEVVVVVVERQGVVLVLLLLLQIGMTSMSHVEGREGQYRKTHGDEHHHHLNPKVF